MKINKKSFFSFLVQKKIQIFAPQILILVLTKKLQLCQTLHQE